MTTITRKGWAAQCAASLRKKEATYDAGISPFNATTAMSLTGFTVDRQWPDTLIHDRSEVSGYVHGTRQELVEKRASFTYTEPHAVPNSVAGFLAMAMGAHTTTQDAALAAYKHVITPAAEGVAPRTIQLAHKLGNVQHKYTGVACGMVKLNADAGGVVGMEANLMGSGTRAIDATAFPALVSESWMRVANCSVWMETGSNILISPALAQGSQDISSGTPDNLGPRLQSMEWTYDPDLQEQPGFGGAGVLQGIEFGRPKITVKLTALFPGGTTELDYYLNQDVAALEFDLKGAQVVATSIYYFGLHLLVPKCQLAKAPVAMGGPDDTCTAELEFEVFDDGTNPASKVVVYNAVPAYLAA